MANSHPFSLLGFGKKPASPVSSAPGQQPATSTAQEPLLGAESEAASRSEAGSAPAASELTFLRGNPSPEEVAAVTSLLLALQTQAAAPQESTLELWQRRLNRTQRLGMRLRPGQGSWRRARPQ